MKFDCLLIGNYGETRNNLMLKRLLPDGIGMNKMFNATVAYLGSYLHKNGITFDYVCSFFEEKEELVEKLGNVEYLVAVSTTYCISVEPILEIINFIRQWNNGVKIVLGGPFIASVLDQLETSERQLFLSRLNADFYINTYQGERELAELVKVLKRHDTNYLSVHNIYYRENNMCNSTITMPYEREHLWDNPINWQLFKDRMSNYVSVRTSLSCPFSCAFCSRPQNDGGYEFISARKIESELDVLSTFEEVKGINFIDDTFNYPADRFCNILEKMVKKKYRFRWHAFIRSELLSEKAVELMKASNCEGVLLGFESANQSVLDNMNKKVRVEQYERGHDLLKKYNINTMALLIVGFPGETKNTIRDTIDFLERNAPTFYRTELWFYKHTTPIHKRKEEFQLEGGNYKWRHSTMDFDTAWTFIDEIRSSVRNSICVNTIPYSYIFQLLNSGCSTADLKNMTNKFKQTNIKES